MTTEPQSDSAALSGDRSVPDSRLRSTHAEPTLEGVYSPAGVDRTVIRWMLERTPEERLHAAQQLIDAAWTLRGDEA